MKFVLKITILILSCMIYTVSFAGVYHCLGKGGTVELRDTPCQTTQETTQSFLSYTYSRTDPKRVQSQGNDIQKLQNEVQTQEKKTARIQKRLKKQNEKDALKEQRRAMRCLRTQEQIKQIEAQLRAGCSPHRCNQLKTKLRHHELMKHRYCQIQKG